MATEFEILFKKLKTELKEELLADLKPKGDSPEADLISENFARNLTAPPIARSQLYKWQQRGCIPVFKVGKRTYYSRTAMLSYLTKCRKLPANPQ